MFCSDQRWYYADARQIPQKSFDHAAHTGSDTGTGQRFNLTRLARPSCQAVLLIAAVLTATARGISDGAALKNGMKEKSREFAEKGNELYAKA